MATHALAADGSPVTIQNGKAIGNTLTDKDRVAYDEFMRKMQRFARVLLRIMNMPAPRLTLDDWTDRVLDARTVADVFLTELPH